MELLDKAKLYHGRGGRRLRQLTTDGAKVFTISATFDRWCRENSVYPDHSCPYQHNHNAKVERAHRDALGAIHLPQVDDAAACAAISNEYLHLRLLRSRIQLALCSTLLLISLTGLTRNVLLRSTRRPLTWCCRCAAGPDMRDTAGEPLFHPEEEVEWPKWGAPWEREQTDGRKVDSTLGRRLGTHFANHAVRSGEDPGFTLSAADPEPG